MAKATVHNTPVVHLELTADEALWLRALLQNPIGGEEDEYERNRKPRESIFSALPLETTLRSFSS
jgi:hypothetical protein